MRSILLAVVAATLVCACKTPTAMTARATGCSTKDVEIVDSRYKREGSTTAWCARCKGKVYICAASTSRDRVECREAITGSPCG